MRNLSHRRLARTVSREVDIIVGAHSHTLLFTGETPDGSTPLGDYPTVVMRDDGHTVSTLTQAKFNVE